MAVVAIFSFLVLQLLDLLTQNLHLLSQRQQFGDQRPQGGILLLKATVFFLQGFVVVFHPGLTLPICHPFGKLSKTPE